MVQSDKNSSSNKDGEKRAEGNLSKVEVKELVRTPSRKDFLLFESIASMPRGSQLPKRVAKDEADRNSYDEDDSGGGIGSCLATVIQTPVLIACAIIIPAFGLAFLIVGAVYLYQCKAEPMIPIWLIVQGLIMLFGIGVGGLAKRSSKNGKVSLPVKLLGFVVTLATLIWFIAGNVWIYQTWATEPDYVHFWFENGCNMNAFRLAFVGIIVLDCLIPLTIVVGIIAYCLRGCKSR